MEQFLGGGLIDCFHDEAEFLVSGFLRRLFSEEQSELLESRAKRSTLLAITVAANV